MSQRNSNDGDNKTTKTQDFASFQSQSNSPPASAPSSDPSTDAATDSAQGTAKAAAFSLPRPSPYVHYNLSLDTDGAGHATASASQGILRSDTQMSRADGFSPILRRRNTRAATFRTVEDFEDFDVRQGWHPGSEPGVDPEKPDGGHSSMPVLQVPCDITVVDFSQNDMEMHHLDNDTLPGFLSQKKPMWSKCRWINVNGLSWDVIQALGKYKKLHKLAIEDILNTRNRTKADWYSNHAFIVLTLQKLVHLTDPDDSSCDEDDDDSENDAQSYRSSRSGGSRKAGGIFRRLRRWFRSSKRSVTRRKDSPLKTLENGEVAGAGASGVASAATGTGELKSQPTGFSEAPNPLLLRTLQRYHASPNDARTEFMEKFSVLAESNLAVTAEQVSLFITNDNTIISFFELSAEDVEVPILTRLSTPDTILRQSCDASMVGQAIMDAIIDLAIPVTACYGDVIGDLELDVLTRPNITHTKKLYITITEINKMLSFINPIIGLVNSLRDHKTDMHQDVAAQELQNPLKGVVITPMTHTYLGDVLDHCVLITEALQQLKDQADGMIDLIFNTVTTYQNESLKQLTIMTIIFLPLTFITGYFGQNFQPFDVLYLDVAYFWKIAVPVVVGTILILMRDIIWESITSMIQRQKILRSRHEMRKKRRKNTMKSA